MTIEQFGRILMRTVAGAAVVLPLLFTVAYSRKYAVRMNKVALFLCLFNPLNTLSFMFGHLLGVSLVHGGAILRNEENFDFRLYSLLLLGIVFFGFGWYLLQKLQQYCKGNDAAANDYLRASLYLAVLTLPMGYGQFGGFIMGGGALLGALSLFLARRKTTMKAAVRPETHLQYNEA